MKQSLPPNIKLSQDTRVLMQACVQEFITFITCEAQERADSQRRSTLNGDDILHALSVLGFEEYEKLGRVWLSRYRVVSSLACGVLRDSLRFTHDDQAFYIVTGTRSTGAKQSTSSLIY